jgi:hypothetical protein
MSSLRTWKVKIGLVLLHSAVLGQSVSHYYDLRKFNLGFAMGLNLSDVRFQRLDYNVSAANPLKMVFATIVPGLNLGLITNTRLSDHADFRFIPTVSLQQRNFLFQTRDSSFKRKLEASYLDLPFGFKLKSDVWNDLRVYVYAGGKYSINLMSDKKVKSDPTLIKIDRTDWSIEFAAGIDIYGDRVKLTPEIKYAIGLKNIYIPDTEEHPVKEYALTSQSLTLSLYFE